VALILFGGAWLAIPGGKAELLVLVADVRSALQRKVAVQKTVEPVPVA